MPYPKSWGDRNRGNSSNSNAKVQGRIYTLNEVEHSKTKLKEGTVLLLVYVVLLDVGDSKLFFVSISVSEMGLGIKYLHFSVWVSTPIGDSDDL